MALLLGVNIDHVATLRNARGGKDPLLLQVALAVEDAGADSITMHLREDRRHIRDEDLFMLSPHLRTSINLEISALNEMVNVAGKLKPKSVCLVPERREEITTEGGLDVVCIYEKLAPIVEKLFQYEISVSLFIDPEEKQVLAAKRLEVNAVEFHTGKYANAQSASQKIVCFSHLSNMVKVASELGLTVNAGHGLTRFNVGKIASINLLNELNVGHSLVARSIMIGLPDAVREFRQIMLRGSV